MTGKGRSAPKMVQKSKGKKPKIIVKDIKLSDKYYRTTGIQIKEDKWYIYHQTKEQFFQGLRKLKSNLAKHYGITFTPEDIQILGTKTHRYVSTTFIAKGFKP